MLIPFLKKKDKSLVEKCCFKFWLLKKLKCNDIRTDTQQQRWQKLYIPLLKKYSASEKKQNGADYKVIPQSSVSNKKRNTLSHFSNMFKHKHKIHEFVNCKKSFNFLLVHGNKV